VETRYDALVERLREAARPEGPEPAVAHDYLERVRTGAYAISDEDVRALARAGLSEDEIFHLTVAAAVGAGLERLRAGLGTLA
jgi:alkylhydroperoxidase family enzyme